MEVPAAREEAPEVLSPFRVQRHHLAVENRLLHPELLPDPVAQLPELLEDVAALRPEVAVSAAEEQEAAEAVVLGLEQVGGIIERLVPWYGNDWLAPRGGGGGPGGEGGPGRVEA